MNQMSDRGRDDDGTNSDPRVPERDQAGYIPPELPEFSIPDPPAEDDPPDEDDD